MHTPTAHIALNAHLLATQASYRSAGINGYIYNLLAALPAADPALHYTVLTGSRAQPPANLTARDRVQVRRARWDTQPPLRRLVWEQAIQPWALAQTAPDLVHALAFVGPLLRWGAGRAPLVVTVYDLSFVHHPQRLPAARRLYLRRFTRWTVARAQRVIAISHSTARDLTATLGVPADRIDVAPPGVGAAFKPLPAAAIDEFRRAQGLPERFLLFVGTLEPRKNLPVLLRAYAQLPEATRRTVHLVLGGGRGWMADAVFETIETHDLGATVHLPGYLPDADLPLWYNAAEALVYPSVFEGFGLPVIEALACGTPALVADASSLPEAVGNGGLRLPPDDEDAWAVALDRTIHDEYWRTATGARGRTHAARFTWAQTAAQTVASYRRALHRE